MSKQYRLNKVIFKNLVSLINEFYKKWVTSPFIHSINFLSSVGIKKVI